MKKYIEEKVSTNEEQGFTPLIGEVEQFIVAAIFTTEN